MKKLLLSYSCVVCLLFFTAKLSYASPTYYTFTGVITYIDNSSGYDYGLAVGDILTHTYLFDKDLRGYYTRENGIRVYQEDEFYSDGTIKQDSYYSKLISGRTLNNPTVTWGGNQTIANYATDYYDNSGNYVGVATWTGSSHNETQSIYGSLSWMTNSGMFCYYTVGGTIEDDRVIRQVTSLTISNSPPSPVPLPPSILLLGSGLVGLVGFRKKIKVI
jgi:hypothetical protein